MNSQRQVQFRVDENQVRQRSNSGSGNSNYRDNREGSQNQRLQFAKTARSAK
jgi:hypothetical protein